MLLLDNTDPSVPIMTDFYNKLIWFLSHRSTIFVSMKSKHFLNSPCYVIIALIGKRVFNEPPIRITEGEISTFLQKINHFYP